VYHVIVLELERCEVGGPVGLSGADGGS
jgi:hypothetical protein